jgi:hypothetical protein
MRATPKLATSLLAISTIICSSQSQTRSDVYRRDTSCGEKSAKILILGTYHMNNPGLDDVNTQADDVLSSRRQREIEELIERLARFKPTRIAIESPYRSTTWTSRYEKFLAGEYKLGRNEIEQIGFRLGKRLNLPALHPIDYPMFMSGLTPSEIENPTPPPKSAPEPKKTGPAPLSEDDKLLRRSTVSEFLLYLNSDEEIQDSHVQYMNMLLPTNSPAIYGRTDLVTNWYKRNLRMFANINRVTEFGRDRVVVIVGAGHLKLLRDFAIDSPYFCLVDTEAYLK